MIDNLLLMAFFFVASLHLTEDINSIELTRTNINLKLLKHGIVGSAIFAGILYEIISGGLIVVLLFLMYVVRLRW